MLKLQRSPRGSFFSYIFVNKITNSLKNAKPKSQVIAFYPLKLSRRSSSSAALDRLTKYFTISNMPVVSSRYWNEVHGNTPDEVRRDLEGMQVMRVLGRNMAWLLRCIEAARSVVPYPEAEAPIWTNFVR